MLGLGGPGADEADDLAAVVEDVEGLATDGLLERLGLLGRGRDEDLVAHRVAVELVAGAGQALAQSGGALVGVAGELPVELLAALVLGEGRLELGTQQKALGEQAAALLLQKAEGLTQALGVRAVAADDDGLAHEHAVLGAADVEGVDAAGDVGEREVVARRGQGAAQAGAVQEDAELVAAGPVADGVEALAAPCAAELGGVGDVDGCRARHVTAGAHLELVDLLGGLGGEEAVGVGGGQAGAAGRGQRARLVDDDVGVGRADDALPVAQHAVQADDVGARAADAELHHGVFAAAGLADELAGVVAVGVTLGVAHVLLGADGLDGCHDLGRGALGVVVAEQVHGRLLASWPAGRSLTGAIVTRPRYTQPVEPRGKDA